MYFWKQFKILLENKLTLSFVISILILILLISFLVIFKILPWQWLPGFVTGILFFSAKLFLYRYVYELFVKEAKSDPKSAKRFIWLFILINFLISGFLLFLVVYFHQIFNIIAFIIAFTLIDILTIITYLMNFKIK